MVQYQNMLFDELLKRQIKNPSYSIRSFARDLSLSQSFLTQVLNKKKNLSFDKAVIVSEKLKLKGNTKKIFLNLIRLQHAKGVESRKSLRNDIDALLRKNVSFKQLSEDVFNVVADCHYFAILELSSIENFKSDPTWIAKKLKLPVLEIKNAISKLKELKLLEEVDGKLQKFEKDYLFENVSSEAIRKHHHGTLELAHKALEEQPMNEREFFTVCFPMDPSEINEVKDKIRAFSETLMAEMQETKPKAVYKLAVQFFRMDDGEV